MNKIRHWFNGEGISVEDAFRVFDKDFDGRIDRCDIRDFCTEILRISDKEID